MKQKYRRLEENEYWRRNDIIHYTDGGILTVHDGLIGNKLQGRSMRDSYDYIERPLYSKLECCDIGDVLTIMSDGNGLSPESLLTDVKNMLEQIWKRTSEEGKS